MRRGNYRYITYRIEDSERQKTFLTKERRRWVRINPEQNMGDPWVAQMRIEPFRSWRT